MGDEDDIIVALFNLTLYELPLILVPSAEHLHPNWNVSQLENCLGHRIALISQRFKV